MKNILKDFTFPFKTTVLFFSAVMIFLPVFLINILDTKSIIDLQPYLFRFILVVPSFIASVGFIYCTLGYHFQIVRGDELKFKIHLESLNIAFTTALVFLFALVFVFMNFAPTMLNYIMIILSIVAILSYVIGAEFVKKKYE